MSQNPASYKKSYINTGILIAIALVIGFFTPRMMAYLPAFIGIVLFVNATIKQKTLPALPKRELAFMLALFALMALSMLWSPNPQFTLERIIKLALIAIPSMLLISQLTQTQNFTRQQRHNFKIFLIIFQIIAACFLMFEQNTNFFISNMFISEPATDFHLNRSFVIFAFLSLMTHHLCLNLECNKPKKITLVIATMALSFTALYFSVTQTAQLSYLCGLIFLFAFPIRSKPLIKIFFISVIALTLILPIIMPIGINLIHTTIPEDVMMDGVLRQASIVHRFEVWNFTLTEIQKSPFYGHGIEAQRFMKADQWMPHEGSYTILHAHNAALQIWLELGIIGALFAATFIYYIYTKVYSAKDIQTRRLYLTIFAAAFCCAMTGFGVWQSWQVGLFFLLAALNIVLSKNEDLEKIS